MSASNWGGTNGSWTLTDINGAVLMQGSGNFGDSTYADFYVDSAIPSSVKGVTYPRVFELFQIHYLILLQF